MPKTLSNFNNTFFSKTKIKTTIDDSKFKIILYSRTLSQRPKGVALPSLDSGLDKTLFENGFSSHNNHNNNNNNGSYNGNDYDGVIDRDVIVVSNARKSYGRGKGRHEVLKGIDITVKEGSM
jgi:hypothetical protein